MVRPIRSIASRRIFVDSGAYLALLDADDEHHEDAIAILTELAHGGWRQLTTNALIIECHALILANLGIAQAAQFLRDIDASRTTIVRVRAADEARAKERMMTMLRDDAACAARRHVGQRPLSTVFICISSRHPRFLTFPYRRGGSALVH
jgi:predicted nucleic acid-binding protein